MDLILNDMRLIHGDCLERMKELPDNSIDLTVTSPPYDNLRTYNGETITNGVSMYGNLYYKTF